MQKSFAMNPCKREDFRLDRHSSIEILTIMWILMAIAPPCRSDALVAIGPNGPQPIAAAPTNSGPLPCRSGALAAMRPQQTTTHRRGGAAPTNSGPLPCRSGALAAMRPQQTTTHRRGGAAPTKSGPCPIATDPAPCGSDALVGHHIYSYLPYYKIHIIFQILI